MKRIFAFGFVFGYLAGIVLAHPVAASDVEVEGADPAYAATEPDPGSDHVSRATFTTDMLHREPVDELTVLPMGAQRLHFFTDLRDLSGETIVHRWERAGEVRAEVSFDVRGPRWRVWSSKELMPGEGGEWTVSVLNGAGGLLASRTLGPASE